MNDAELSAVAVLLQDGADADSVTILRCQQDEGRAVVMAHWRTTGTGVERRGGIGLEASDGRWVPSGAWSSNLHHDSGHPVWLAWGGDSHSTSGWVRDPLAQAVRARDTSGSTATGMVEQGIAILVTAGGFGSGSIVEVLDDNGVVLHAGPLHGR